MIRRDFILRMIEEFAQALARINSFKRDGRWSEASETLDTEFKRLIGEGSSRTIVSENGSARQLNSLWSVASTNYPGVLGDNSR